MATAGSKDSYIIMLENSKEPPKLISSVKPQAKKNTFLISLLHPNTKEVVYSKEHVCKDINEAFKIAKELKTKEEFSNIKTVYEEQRFIPKPRKGKMHLKTKKEAVAEQLGDAAKPAKSPKAAKTAKPKKAAKVKKSVAKVNKKGKNKKR